MIVPPFDSVDLVHIDFSSPSADTPRKNEASLQTSRFLMKDAGRFLFASSAREVVLRLSIVVMNVEESLVRTSSRMARPFTNRSMDVLHHLHAVGRVWWQCV